MLADGMADADFPARLAAVAAELLATAPCDEIVLAGGGAGRPGVAESLLGLGRPVRVAPGGVYAGAAGALALAGGRDAALLDLGQSAAKVVYRSRGHRAPRDLAVLPLAHESRQRLDALRPRVVEFAAGALQRGCAGAVPELLVLALPCEVDGDCAAAACTYPYPAPDPELARDLRAAAGFARVPALVLNDAELIAIGVAAEPAALAGRRSLVFTLGFGPGCASVGGPA